jgi:hypothetical protein
MEPKTENTTTTAWPDAAWPDVQGLRQQLLARLTEASQQPGIKPRELVRLSAQIRLLMRDLATPAAATDLAKVVAEAEARAAAPST